MEWIKKHPILKLSDIISDVAGYFLNEVRYQKNEITEETKIELLEWRNPLLFLFILLLKKNGAFIYSCLK